MDLKDRAILGKTISDQTIKGRLPDIEIELGTAMIKIAEKVDRCLAYQEERVLAVETYDYTLGFKETLLNHFKNHLIEV